MADLYEATEEMHRLSKLLDDGLAAMRRYAQEYANAEAEYRKAKALAWAATPRILNGDKLTVPEREAMVNANTADLRRTRDLADDMRKAALEAVRSRRGQVSALQTLLNVQREEAAFARTGYQGGE